MRSLLFVPADSERKIARAMGAGADVLILDIEDSVVPERKPAARHMAAELIRAHVDAAARPLFYVRINALDTPHWEADLAATIPARPDGVMLPKPRSGDDVHRLSIQLGHLEETNGLASGAIRIVPIVTETPSSVLAMASYVGASRRLTGLTWGAEDLSAEIGASTARESDGRFTSPFRLVRDLTLLTARAADVEPIDTVFANFRDLATFEREAREAVRDGFTAKMAIHPDQVPVINAVFSPSPEEIARARAIVDLFAADTGAGVISVDGRMLDRPHLRWAERTLARAERPSV